MIQIDGRNRVDVPLAVYPHEDIDGVVLARWVTTIWAIAPSGTQVGNSAALRKPCGTPRGGLWMVS
jgi:hypothetical protein